MNRRSDEDDVHLVVQRLGSSSHCLAPFDKVGCTDGTNARKREGLIVTSTGGGSHRRRSAASVHRSVNRQFNFLFLFNSQDE